jgi:hypothetical protein
MDAEEVRRTDFFLHGPTYFLTHESVGLKFYVSPKLNQAESFIGSGWFWSSVPNSYGRSPIS